jgi:hypothetical protein
VFLRRILECPSSRWSIAAGRCRAASIRWHLRERGATATLRLPFGSRYFLMQSTDRHAFAKPGWIVCGEGLSGEMF